MGLKSTNWQGRARLRKKVAAQQQQSSSDAKPDFIINALEPASDSAPTISLALNSAPTISAAPSNVAHGALAGSINLPTPIPGVIIDIPVAYIPATKRVCLGIGAGLGTPGASGGVVGSDRNIEGVLSGFSLSGSFQGGVMGAQVMGNSNGMAGGNSMVTPGASVTATYSWCF